MCMMSAVFDQWKPAFPDPNLVPHVYPWHPNTSAPSLPQPVPVEVGRRYTAEELTALIVAFEKARDAAQTFDTITGQPDCEDAEKAKLLERIADLEARLAALEA